MLHCLAKDPALRFTDGNELADALERFDQREPIPIPVVETADPALAWWASKRALVGAAVLAALIAVPVIAVFSSGDQPAASAGEDDDGRLPNVGGLTLKSPTVPGGLTRATPSPTPSERDKDRKQEDPATADDGGRDDRERDNDERDPEPEPTPEPTEGEPEPEPTSNETPAP